ncbi:MAG: tRNA (adenosine(37)-N6)-dimethylallyltransferase MiaA [Bernardetiaceae bacterium]|nr:tRNA (adenosine(37)-N6)-dimethylallyltransferase MiaA [Bernardetiaceae bacterium]
MSSQPTLIVIAGATAVGKTSLAIRLAQKLGCEILSADSRQFYKEMHIGTAKPTAEEMQGVVHHFIDSHSIHQAYTVGDYEKEALSKLAQIFQKNHYAILCGGSGLFVRAVCEGIDQMPQIQPQLRQALQSEYEQQGLEPLCQEIAEKDPLFYQTLDRSNPQRVLRAVEVMRSSGRSYSFFRKNKPQKRPFKILKFIAERPREELYARIEKRVDMMQNMGLLTEAEQLYPYRHYKPLQTVGYRELFSYMEGELSLEEAFSEIKKNTRRYAKRQLTWFRKNADFESFDADKFETLLCLINKHEQ